MPKAQTAPKTGTPRSPEKQSALKTEIATRARSIDYSFFGGFLPNPDPVLKKMGKDQAVYDEILGDGHLTGIIGQRSAGVKSLKWDIDRGKAKSEAAALIAERLQKMDMDRITRSVLEANYRGYQPMEVMWGFLEGSPYIFPLDVVEKPPAWFQYGEENELRFRTLTDIYGEELPPRKFLNPRRNPTYNNPYGDALLSKCYWPAVFKRSGITSWVTFTEKYGIPFAIGKLPRGLDQKEYDALNTLLANMCKDGTAAVPDDSSIELLESKSSSTSSESFQMHIAWADAEMSKAILGHGAGADSTPGKLGGEDNAVEVKEYLVLEDQRLMESTMNQLIQWFYEINFGAGEPPVFVMYKEKDVDKELAERDKLLTEQGVEFSQDYYEGNYGFKPGDIVKVEKPEPKVMPTAGGKPPGKPGQFAEGRGPVPSLGQAAVDDFAEGLDPKELQAQAEGFLKPIIAMVKGAKSYDDILASLGSTFSDMDTKSLIKMLHRAIAVNEWMGRAEAATLPEA
jgi:phage gp29-like protein